MLFEHFGLSSNKPVLMSRLVLSMLGVLRSCAIGALADCASDRMRMKADIKALNKPVSCHSTSPTYNFLEPSIDSAQLTCIVPNGLPDGACYNF